MKLFLLICLLNFTLVTKTCPIIRPNQAKRYVGTEVIVRGKLVNFANSSYAQFATLSLGRDTSNVELMVIIQGEHYTKSDQKTPTIHYIGMLIEIKGQVLKDEKVYLRALDTIKLSRVQK
jgi:hypothetical protein